MGRKNNLVHGGRMTKYKGRAASFAPALNIANIDVSALRFSSISKATKTFLLSALLAMMGAFAPMSANAQLYWDGLGAANDSTVTGGAGTWDATTTNWTNGLGITNQAWIDGSNAVFGGAAGGVVELEGDQDVEDIYFNTEGYNISDADGDAGGLVLDSGTSYFYVNQSATISANLTGLGHLAKIRNANLTISGDNNALGYVFVDSGTLILTGSNFSATEFNPRSNGTLVVDSAGGDAINNSIGVRLDGNGIFEVQTDEEIGKLTAWGGAGNVFLNGGTLTTNFDSLSTTALYAEISGTGGFIKSGTSGLNLTAASTYTGATTINGGILQASNASALGDNSALTVTGAGTLNLSTDLAIGSLAGAGNVTLNANSLSTGGDNADTGFSGIISGTGGLSKNGSGTQILSGNNIYTGTTTISAGILNITGSIDSTAININNAGQLNADANAFVASAAINLNDTATFQNNGNNAINSLTSSAGSTINFNAGVLNLSSSVWDTIDGNITGAGGLTKTGTGWLTFAGTNTYAGLTTISAGTISLDSTTAISDAGAVQVNGGGRLNIAANTVLGSIAGSGLITLPDGLILTIGDNNSDSNFSGNFDGGGNGGRLIKQGNGILTLSGDNSGDLGEGIFLEGGTLSLQNSTAAGNGTITTFGSVIDYGDGVNIANLININSDTTKLQVLVGTAEQSGIISETGGPRPLEKIGAGELILSGANTYTGATTISAGTLSLNGGSAITDISTVNVASGATLNLQASETIGSLAGAGNVTFASNQILTAGANNIDTDYSGLMSNANSLFIKEGDGNMTFAGDNNLLDRLDVEGGTLTLTGANFTTTNSFVINDNSTLVANNAGGNALADGSYIDMVTSSATFEIQTDETIARIDGSGSVFLNGGNLTVGDNFSGFGISGVVSGSGGIIKQGTSELNLNSANTYLGDTIVNEGTLLIRETGSIASTSIEVNNAASLTAREGTLASGANVSLKDTSSFYVGDNIINTINSVAGTTIYLEYLGRSSTIAGNLTTGNAGDQAIAGNITGIGSLTKQGTGVLTLSGVNIYTGATTISAGTLSLRGGAALNGDLFTSAGGVFDVKGGGTGVFSLTGNVINNGIFTMQDALVGDKITIAGDYSGTGELKIDVNNTNEADYFDVTGAVTLGGTLDVFSTGVEADYPLGDNFTYTLIANDGTDVVSGTFASIENNFAFLDPTINTSGGDGNDVVLTMVHTNPVPDFKPFATNANQSSVAKALDNFNYDSTDGQIVRNAIIGLNNAQAEAALVQFSGADHEASSGLGNIISGAFRSVMMGRSGTMGSSSAQSSLALGYAQAPQTNNETLNAINEAELDGQTFSQPSSTIWTKAFASYSSVDGGANSANIYAFNAGVVFGGEITDPNLGLFGISAGYSGSQFSTITAGATSKADNFHVGLYGMWGSAATAEAGWGFSGALDYTYNMYETRRPINVGGLDLTAAADYGGYSIGGEFKARYGFESELFGSNSIISPFAGVNFLNSKNNAYSETGAGALNISAAEVDTNRIASLLGFEISSQAIMGETPVNSRISVGWQHEFGDVNQINSYSLQGSPTQFMASSPQEARDKLVLNAGLDFATSSNAMLTLSANGEASSTSLAYGGSIAYKLRF